MTIVIEINLRVPYGQPRVRFYGEAYSHPFDFNSDHSGVCAAVR